MIRLEPDWIGELLGQWAASERDEAHDSLGYPRVSPMFARAVGTVIDAEDVTGYSSAEMRAVMAAVEWLHLVHYEHWRALSREFRGWTRATLEAKEGDRELVLEAGQMLAKYIDEVLG